MAAALALAAASSAAQAADAPGDAHELDAVVVEGHYDNAVGTSDAASQGTVTSKLIENRPTLRPGEVLEFVPGLIVTQHSGDGKANQYFLRGFNLDHGTDFATYIAGMPVNMRSHAHGQGYTDVNFMIPELVSRIDYRKGPYYAEEGDFASAGAAHIHYMDRLAQPFALATVGQNGYARLLGAGSRAAGGGTLLGALELGHSDGPWDVPEGFRKVNGVLGWSASNGPERFGLTAMAYSARWTATDQIPQRAVDSGLTGRFGTLDSSDGGRTARYSLSGEYSRAIGSGAFDFNAYLVRSRLDLYSNFTYFSGHPFDLGDAINGDQFHQSERRTLMGANAVRTWVGKLANRESVTKLGLQARFDHVDPLALTETVQRVEQDVIRADDVKEGSVGVFVENALQWLPWLRTVAGLRYDRYDFRVASDNPLNSGNVRAGMVSPKFAAVFGPWSHFEFFANYGQGFHSNDARGTTTHVTPGPSGGTPIDPVTPLVKTRGSEVGARTDAVAGLQSSLALWQLKLGSELVFAGDAGDTQVSRPSKRYGIEWNNHWVVNPSLLLDFDLALSRAGFTTDDPATPGNYIPGSIDRVATFGLTVPNYRDWFGTLQWRYFGPRPLIEDNSQRSQSTLIANLRLGRQINRDWRITLDVMNVFNRQASDIDYYYVSRLPGEPHTLTGAADDGVPDRHFHPIEPRALRLTLQMKF